MTARSHIFAAITRANTAHDPSQIAADAAALLADPQAIQPKFDTPLDRFIAKATSERVTATVERIKTLADAPAAVARYRTDKGITTRTCLQPRDALTALKWNTETSTTADVDETLTVSMADHAIAETGSVVFLSAPDAPVLHTFVTLHHIVIVDAATILPYPEDFWAKIGPNNHPRNINIVTGTSGTADIEAKNIRGAHGPRFMHILIKG